MIRDFALRYTDAWCSQDPAKVAAFFSPEGSLAVNGAVATGRDAIAEVAREFMASFPDLHLTMDDLDIEGERVEYHWTLVGTHIAAGAKVRISGFEEWRFGPDGLIAESQGHFDSDDYERQLRSAPRVNQSISDPSRRI